MPESRTFKSVCYHTHAPLVPWGFGNDSSSLLTHMIQFTAGGFNAVSAWPHTLLCTACRGITGRHGRGHLQAASLDAAPPASVNRQQMFATRPYLTAGAVCSNVRVVLRVAKWDKSHADTERVFFLFFFISNRNTLSRCLSLFGLSLSLVFRPFRSSASFHSCSWFHHFCTLFLQLVWWRAERDKVSYCRFVYSHF